MAPLTVGKARVPTVSNCCPLISQQATVGTHLCPCPQSFIPNDLGQASSSSPWWLLRQGPALPEGPAGGALGLPAPQGSGGGGVLTGPPDTASWVHAP